MSRVSRAEKPRKKSEPEKPISPIDQGFLQQFSLFTRIADAMLERSGRFNPAEVHRVLQEASRQANLIGDPRVQDGETYAWALERWHELDDAVKLLEGKRAPARASDAGLFGPLEQAVA